MSDTLSDPFGARASLDVGGKQFLIYSLAKLGQQTGADLCRLPFSIRVVLEALLRNVGDGFTSVEDVTALANWTPESVGSREVAFTPARVLLQDFTGVPAVVDLAAMRDAMQQLGGDPTRINPLLPADLVIDHSVQVDAFGSNAALLINADSNSSAIASATSSCAGARRRSTTSASCRRPPASSTRSTWNTWPRWCRRA